MHYFVRVKFYPDFFHFSIKFNVPDKYTD